MVLRVNARCLTRDDYLGILRKAGIPDQAAPYTQQGVFLSQPIDVESLPGFQEGWVSVQDAAAQLAAPLLDLVPGQRVLDACAAPGGKAAHILETCPQGVTLVAVARDLESVNLLTGTLERLRLETQVIWGDATRPKDWWDGRWFDRILLDAPCSGSGVIRRHPDIKTLRRVEDIAHLARDQSRLLAALWSILAPGDKLLYVACSMLPVENQRQIASFLDQYPEAWLSKLEAPWG